MLHRAHQPPESETGAHHPAPWALRRHTAAQRLNFLGFTPRLERFGNDAAQHVRIDRLHEVVLRPPLHRLHRVRDRRVRRQDDHRCVESVGAQQRDQIHAPQRRHLLIGDNEVNHLTPCDFERLAYRSCGARLIAATPHDNLERSAHLRVVIDAQNTGEMNGDTVGI